MVPYDNATRRPALEAAATALETGEVKFILAWTPEQHRNKMKNLFEKTVCEKRTGHNSMDLAVHWYLRTVTELCCNDCREPGDLEGGSW